MKQNFSEIFLTKIRGKLVLIEQDRKKGLRLFSILIFIGVLVLMKAIIAKTLSLHIIFICFIPYFLIVDKISFYSYRKKYKERILKIIFDSYLEKGFFYPGKYLRESEYVESFLYQGTYNKYTGEDYAEGFFQGVEIRLSELFVTHEKRNSNASLNSRIDSRLGSYSGMRTKSKETTVVFSGLFIVCDLPHSFKGITVVEHDQTEKFLGAWLGGLLKKSKSAPMLSDVRLESPEFEKEFRVTADDQIEARKILTPYMQEHLMRVVKKMDYPFGLSITPNRLNIALFTRKNFFEPPILSTCVDAKSLREVDLVFRLVNEINQEIKKL